LLNNKDLKWDESSLVSLRKWNVAVTKSMLPDLVFPEPVLTVREEDSPGQDEKNTNSQKVKKPKKRRKSI